MILWGKRLRKENDCGKLWGYTNGTSVCFHGVLLFNIKT